MYLYYYIRRAKKKHSFVRFFFFVLKEKNFKKEKWESRCTEKKTGRNRSNNVAFFSCSFYY